MGEHLLAVDPGGTTGLAWCPMECLGMKVDSRLGKMIEMGQIEGDVGRQSAALGRGIVKLKVRIVVSESSDQFLLAPRQGAMRKHSLIPIKMSGAVQACVGIMNDRFKQMSTGEGSPPVKHEQMLMWHEWPMVFVEQTPSQAKSVVGNEVLKALGVEWTSKSRERHQLDAARHLVTFLRRYGAQHQRKASGSDGGDGRSPFRIMIDEGLDRELVRREHVLGKIVEGDDG